MVPCDLNWAKEARMRIRSTTIVAVRQNNTLAIAGDGQVTFDKTVMKQRARKVRRMFGGRIIGGFAGSAADGLTLFEKLEACVETYRGNLLRAAVELAKEWRTDKYLRRLEALLVVGDADHLLVISGQGDVIEPDDGIAAIGSGGSYALAAARALVNNTSLPPDVVVRQALEIAASICVYTNHEITVEVVSQA
jgi:ATP-dependent HslUV protease, peptidase subunit HslV